MVQAKSKRLTIESRKGNDLQLKDDFKKAVQDAYDQALLCAETLTSDGFRFVDSSGTEIGIAHKPRIVFPICIVSDHYPALAFQARQFLKTTVTTSIQPPLVTDVFALDALAEMLNTPLHFLNYLALRGAFRRQGNGLARAYDLGISPEAQFVARRSVRWGGLGGQPGERSRHRDACPTEWRAR